jgi:hypothetical protein
MHARFVFQLRIDFVAFDERGRFFVTTDAGLGRVEDFHAPALTLGVATVHAQHLGGKERRLIAARARANFEDDVLLVVRVGRQQQHSQVFFATLQLLLQSFDFDAREFAHLLVVGVHVEHLTRAREFFFDRLPLAIPLHHVAEAAVLLGGFGVGRLIRHQFGRVEFFG